MSRFAALILALATLATSSLAATGVAAATKPTHTPRTTLPAIERQVMCVTCKIPLNVAESPQADRERAYIQGLIDEGLTEAQIKRSLVAQYGPTVLALPSHQGFDLAAYLVPIVAVGGVLLMLALMLPRWRRRAREENPSALGPPPLSSADASRLEEDLARYDT